MAFALFIEINRNPWKSSESSLISNELNSGIKKADFLSGLAVEMKSRNKSLSMFKFPLESDSKLFVAFG